MALKSTQTALGSPLKTRCACVLSLSAVSNSLCPWTAAHQTTSVHRIFQARMLEWVAISYSRGSFWQGLNLHLLRWQPDTLPLCRLVSPCRYMKRGNKSLMLTFPAEVEPGNTLHSCFSSLTINKYPVSGLFTASFFAFLYFLSFCTFWQFCCLK